jgi:hypothetical protein
VPIVFLAAFGTDRTPGPSFRPELDDIMPKPFRLEQLEGVIVGVLERLGLDAVAPVAPAPRRTQGAPDRRQAMLSGSLAEFGASSMLVVLELERKSGVLSLGRPGASGRIFVRDGRVVRAQVDGPGRRRGAMAVFELLTWSEGRFEFVGCEVPGEDEVGSSTTFLLLEGARLRDEADREQQESN